MWDALLHAVKSYYHWLISLFGQQSGRVKLGGKSKQRDGGKKAESQICQQPRGKQDVR